MTPKTLGELEHEFLGRAKACKELSEMEESNEVSDIYFSAKREAWLAASQMCRDAQGEAESGAKAQPGPELGERWD